MKSFFFLLLLVTFITPAICRNEANPANPSPGTLQQQYQYLKSDLEIIEGYRMIKMYTMDRFWNVVMDSVYAKKAKINESAVMIARQQKEISDLHVSLKKTEKEKEDLAAGVDNLLVLGKQYPKQGFITVVSFVVLGLVVLAGILFSVSRISYRTTAELRKLNESLYQEFDAYKHHAVEKQIKLSRELQDYRNKFTELKVV